MSCPNAKVVEKVCNLIPSTECSNSGLLPQIKFLTTEPF